MQSDMGQAPTQVIEAQLKHLGKVLKHQHKHKCFNKQNA